MGKRLSESEVQKRYRLANISLIGEYISTSIKTLASCNTCSHTWFPTPGSIFNGSRCPKCQQSNTRLTEVEADVRYASKNIERLEPYVNTRTKTAVKCLKCSHIWSPTPDSIFSGTGCPQCAKIATNISRQVKQEKIYLNKAKLLGYEVLDKYISSITPIMHRHNICGLESYMKPASISSGHICCPICIERRRHLRGANSLTEEKFRSLALNTLVYLYLLRTPEFIKVGVSSNIPARLNVFKSQGLKVLDVSVYATNNWEAYMLENLILTKCIKTTLDYKFYGSSEVIQLAEYNKAKEILLGYSFSKFLFLKKG